jgi:hypothetical protein
LTLTEKEKFLRKAESENLILFLDAAWVIFRFNLAAFPMSSSNLLSFFSSEYFTVFSRLIWGSFYSP